MKLQNPFPLKVRKLYMDCWECFICTKNGSTSGGLELHHIKGRESDSVLNAALVCGMCHSHMNHSDQEEEYLMMKAVRYAVKHEYQLLKGDLRFYLKHKKIYDKIESKGITDSKSYPRVFTVKEDLLLEES